ncbi:MAG: hypothetical protein EHM28_01670, partial [Spirochaetaceae bacterium]
MDQINGKISARTMHWLFFPEFAGEQEQFELLQYDILLKRYHTSVRSFFDSVRGVPSADLLVINIDAVLRYEPEEPEKRTKVLSAIRDNTPRSSASRCHLYTRDLQPVREVFHDHPAVVVHAWDVFSKKKDFVPTLLTLIRSPGFAHRAFRGSIRIPLYPQATYKASCHITDYPEAIIEGYVKDISRNGAGLILYIKRLVTIFNVNDVISVSITFPNTIMELKKAIVRRISLHEQLVG